MEKIEIIKKFFRENKIRWTNHIVMRLIQRNITQKDIEETILNGEIIEEYENDYPYPSYLIFGVNYDNKVIHIVCGVNEDELWLVTAYYPDDIEWEKDYKTRKENK